MPLVNEESPSWPRDAISSHVVNCLHPPYPVLVVSFIFAGFGNGLTDSAWNAWIGNMANADELLGFLHGFYDVGAVLSPLAAASLVTKANCPWYYFLLYHGASPSCWIPCDSH